MSGLMVGERKVESSKKNALILASGSETRRRMLVNAGLSFDVIRAQVDEEALKESLLAETAPAKDVADSLADAKARSVTMMHPGRVVLGADQILVQDGRVFSKAKTAEQAKTTLKALSGQAHRLISAAVIYEGDQPVWRAATTATLTMRNLSDEFIDYYLTALGDDAFWSVGCYQLEGLGAQLFSKIDGDYFTILGLPLLPVLDFLRGRAIVPT